MMDHYQVLGLSRNASKDEIKEAFRKLAVKLHPDKHSHSSKAVRDSATLRFKQASEAYQVLVDDHKRFHYNRTSPGASSYARNSAAGGGRYKTSAYASTSASASASVSGRFENLVRYLNSRAFLLNLSVGAALLSGVAAVNMGWNGLWKMRNSGKSFEAAMDSVEKAKAKKKL